MTYPEVFSRLTYETAILVFMKKNGDIRLMLGTRNLSTVAIKYGFQGNVLGGHDNRCNIKNGNVAVYDLLLGDARSFHIDRLVSIEFLGELKNEEDLNTAAERFIAFQQKYEESKPTELSMDTLM